MVRLLAGVALAVVLVGAICRAPGVDVPAVLRRSDPVLLVGAAAFFALGLPLMVARWRLLLRVQGVDLHSWILWRLVLGGNFFGLVAPGAAGGDVARAACLAGQTPGRRVEALSTLLVDRVAGALGLVTVATLSAVVALPFLHRLDPRFYCGGMILVGLGGCGLLAGAALAWRDGWGRWLGVPWVARLSVRVLPERVAGLARRAVHALDQYRDAPLALVRAWLLSVAVHLISTVVVVLLSWAVGESAVSLSALFLAVQASNLVGMVPLTPGGVGGRDVTLFYLLCQLGAAPSRAAAIPVLYSGIATFWALGGGLVFLYDPPAAVARSQGDRG